MLFHWVFLILSWNHLILWQKVFLEKIPSDKKDILKAI